MWRVAAPWYHEGAPSSGSVTIAARSGRRPRFGEPVLPSEPRRHDWPETSGSPPAVPALPPSAYTGWLATVVTPLTVIRPPPPPPPLAAPAPPSPPRALM